MTSQIRRRARLGRKRSHALTQCLVQINSMCSLARSWSGVKIASVTYRHFNELTSSLRK